MFHEDGGFPTEMRWDEARAVEEGGQEQRSRSWQYIVLEHSG